MVGRPPPTAAQRPDVGFYAIVALVVIITTWLLLMPFVPAIASATMHRFHLRSGSFTWWAIQQPIPSMYNFANRFQVSDVPPGFSSDPLFADPLFPEASTQAVEKRYLNHFPTRIVTFANTRYRYLNDGQDRWITIDTRYRGQMLESTYHAKPVAEGGFEMVLLREDDSP